MILHKFGGTSVGNAERIARVAGILVEQQERARQRSQGAANPETVAVVSAMSGVTDQLIAGGRAAAEGKDSEYREIKSRLLQKHLEVVEKLLGHSPERLEVGGLVEDRLHDLERLYRSIAVLGEFTVRGCDAVTSL